jgi:hypothetical protein
MSQLFNYANISSSGSWVGGLVGVSTKELLIEQSLNYGTIRGGGQYTGGLIGILWNKTNGVLREVGNFGSIISSLDGAGGLVGGTSGTGPRKITITDSSNLGTVQIITNQRNNAGGIIGFIDDATITFSALYSAAEVTTAGLRAGLIFGLANTIAKVHTDAALFSLNSLEVQVDGYTSSSNNNSSTTAISTKIPVVNMLLPATFINASWNITNTSINSEIWSIGYNGDYTYPYLTFQGVPDEKQIISQNELTASDISTISILEKISEGYIPVASVHDLTAINSTNETTFAIGTEFETRTNGGLNKKYVMITNVAFADGVNGSAPIIAPSSTSFTGTFDGNNFTISNLDLNCTNCSTLALFGRIKDATIKNLVISNFTIDVIVDTSSGASGRKNAILVGEVFSTSNNNNIIENILISDSIQSTNSTHIGQHNHGAVVSNLSGSTNIENITITNLISTGTGVSYQGGLIGTMSSTDLHSLNIENVSLSGMIVGGSRSGGLIGVVGTSSKWTITIDNININPHLFHVTTTINQYYYGGLIGQIFIANTQGFVNLTVRNSLINSDITTFGSSRVGGLISEIRNGNYGLSITLSGVIYNGLINAGNSDNRPAGGFIGELLDNTGLSNIFIENSTFSGIITGSATTNIGGFFGSVSNSNHKIEGVGLSQSGDIINGVNNGHIIANVSGTNPSINISNIFVSPNSRDLKFIGGTFDSKYILDPVNSVTEVLDGSISTP